MANVLIADDSIIMRKNLKTIITKAGHNVVAEAVNGQQAYVLYNKNEIDLVTLDITMPVMDGIEALKKILEKDSEAKVIIISALDQKRMVFQALECGAKYYVIKPVTEEKITNAIDKVLDSNHNVVDEVNNKSENIDETLYVKSPIPVKETIFKQQTPFTIDNVNGTFIVNIYESLNSENVITLDAAMKGFLFIKPLKITFNLHNSGDLNNLVLGKLVQIAKYIKEADGEFNIEGSENIVKFFNL